MHGGLIQPGPERWSAVIYIGKGLDGKKKYREFRSKWLASIKPPRVGPRTHERYTEIVENHLIPALGHIPLQKFSTSPVLGLRRPRPREGASE